MSKRFEDKFAEVWQEVGNMLLEPEVPSALVELVPGEVSEPEPVDEEFFIEVPSESEPGKTHRYDANHLSSDKSRNYQLLAICAMAVATRDREESARRMAHRIIDEL